jgi:hypothetical protein
LISEITSEFFNSNGPIDVTLRYHGAPGQIYFNQGEVVTTGPLGTANFNKMCNKLRGKVRHVTLLSCSVGSGAEGAAFLQALANCLSAPQGTPGRQQVTVSGSTGDVAPAWTRTPQGTNVKWTTAGSVTTASGPP